MALPLFLACFLIPAWFGFFYFRDAKTEEEQLIAPLALGLVNFAIVKSVLTSEGSVPIAFVMAGCIVGVVWQLRMAARAAASTAPVAGTALAIQPRNVIHGYAGGARPGSAAGA